MQWPIKGSLWSGWPISRQDCAHWYASIVRKSLRNPTANEKEPIREKYRGREGTPEAQRMRDLWYKSSTEKERERECPQHCLLSLSLSLSYHPFTDSLSLCIYLCLCLPFFHTLIFPFLCVEGYTTHTTWTTIQQHPYFQHVIPTPCRLIWSALVSDFTPDVGTWLQGLDITEVQHWWWPDFHWAFQSIPKVLDTVEVWALCRTVRFFQTTLGKPVETYFECLLLSFSEMWYDFLQPTVTFACSISSTFL